MGDRSFTLQTEETREPVQGDAPHFHKETPHCSLTCLTRVWEPCGAPEPECCPSGGRGRSQPTSQAPAQRLSLPLGRG